MGLVAAAGSLIFALIAGYVQWRRDRQAYAELMSYKQQFMTMKVRRLAEHGCLLIVAHLGARLCGLSGLC